jgi:hypothetical protein
MHSHVLTQRAPGAGCHRWCTQAETDRVHKQCELLFEETHHVAVHQSSTGWICRWVVMAVLPVYILSHCHWCHKPRLLQLLRGLRPVGTVPFFLEWSVGSVHSFNMLFQCFFFSEVKSVPKTGTTDGLLWGPGSGGRQRSRDSSVGVATGYGLDGQGLRVWVLVRSRIFSSPYRSDWLWGPPSFLSNE